MNKPDELTMRRTRAHLQLSKKARQRATAAFPLHVVQSADELSKLLDIQEQMAEPNTNLQSAIDYIEDILRDEYRRLFGCELGGNTITEQSVVMRIGLPLADAHGTYWWFKPASTITPEVQVLFVRWVRGAIRAVYGGQLVKVTEMRGEWCGPIPWPTCWETCEHGITLGDWCQPCNQDYKRAQADPENV